MSDIFHWRIPQLFPDIPAETQKLLQQYHAELLKFQRTINLVSQKTAVDADLLHISDAICAIRVILEGDKNISKIFDFGSGNGIPGMVFAILCPKTQVTLLDSDQRKCEFLKTAAHTLKLKNVTVMNAQANSLPPNSVSKAICRGFAPLTKTLLLAQNFMKKDGVFYHLKGDNWSLEISEIPVQLCSHWEPGLFGEYKIPTLQQKYAILSTKKLT